MLWGATVGAASAEGAGGAVGVNEGSNDLLFCSIFGDGISASGLFWFIFGDRISASRAQVNEGSNDLLFRSIFGDRISASGLFWFIFRDRISASHAQVNEGSNDFLFCSIFGDGISASIRYCTAPRHKVLYRIAASGLFRFIFRDRISASRA